MVGDLMLLFGAGPYTGAGIATGGVTKVFMKIGTHYKEYERVVYMNMVYCLVLSTCV